MADQLLTMFRGDSAAWDFAATLNGAVVDLTGASVRFTAKNRPDDADVDAVISKTVGAGITLTNASSGLLRVKLAPSDTSGFGGARTLVWDLQARDAAGDVHTLAGGTLRVQPDISRTVP